MCSTRFLSDYAFGKPNGDGFESHATLHVVNSERHSLALMPENDFRLFSGKRIILFRTKFQRYVCWLALFGRDI